jgi:hypothetical protein
VVAVAVAVAAVGSMLLSTNLGLRGGALPMHHGACKVAWAFACSATPA